MAETLCPCCAGLSRRRAVAALFGAAAGLAAPRPVLARALEASAKPEDTRFMRAALAEAALGDFPFGAVIVKNGAAVASGRNSGIKLNDPTAHGEMMAIRAFVAKRPAEELKGAALYTTGEPCAMCMGAILWSGFSRLVYAASIAELSRKIGQIATPSAALAAAAPFADIEITGGVLAAEALALFPP